MKNCGLILSNAISICEMFNTSWQKGKLFLKDDSEKHVKTQWLNMFRFLHETSQGFTNLATQICQEYSLEMHLSR